jgi:hypothetical protein
MSPEKYIHLNSSKTKPIMKISIIAVVVLLLSVSLSQAKKTQKVEFKHNEKAKKVEVFVGGEFFTAFIYPGDMEKQVLYPIVTASGKAITRGYPLDPRPFERTDHPHHVGLWFNFGDVNGLDFWNNSFAIKPNDKPKYGSVKFKKIVSENPESGTLVASSDWVDHEGNVLLSEETTFHFSGEGNLRTIERTSKLTAASLVTFTENKEGLLGLRLDRAFEEPSQKPEKFLDANDRSGRDEQRWCERCVPKRRRDNRRRCLGKKKPMGSPSCRKGRRNHHTCHL